MKKPGAREVALTKLRVAGYHNDTATFTRVCIESRVSHAVAKEQFRIGNRQLLDGVKCDCHECKDKSK